MCSDGIALLDACRQTRANHRAAGGGVGMSPRQGIGFNSMLIRICCSDVRVHVHNVKGKDILVNMTLDGYSNFSLSLAASVFSGVASPLVVDTVADNVESKEGLVSDDDKPAAIGGVSD